MLALLCKSPFLDGGRSKDYLLKQISMKDFITLGKLLLLCQKKACNDAGFENAGELSGEGEFDFLEDWENVFFGFLPLEKNITTCDLFWKGSGIKPRYLNLDVFCWLTALIYFQNSVT